MTLETGLREKKKTETRLLLRRTAAQLFSEQGFDAVTVADIAAAAGVSEKTVFNYFASKEDLVVSGREESEAMLLVAIQERASGEPILTAVHRHLRRMAERLNSLPVAQRVALGKIIKETPSVRERSMQMSMRFEEALSQLIAQETGVPASNPRPRVVARIIGGLTWLVASCAVGWNKGRPASLETSLAEIDAAVQLVSGGLANYGVKA